jgi:hypothetical protein
VAGYRSVPSPRAAHPKNGLSAVQRWGRSLWLVRYTARNSGLACGLPGVGRGREAILLELHSCVRRRDADSRAFRVGLDLRRKRSIMDRDRQIRHALVAGAAMFSCDNSLTLRAIIPFFA